jgi:hypothetical protein
MHTQHNNNTNYINYDAWRRLENEKIKEMQKNKHPKIELLKTQMQKDFFKDKKEFSK